MRIKLLKRVMRDGRLALGVSAAVIIGRFVVDQLAKGAEKAAQSEEHVQGQVSHPTRRKLRAFRVARAIAHLL
ncbi:MAG TPA: hypothetical protein VFJ58_04150 [Armatimonadota bacterium]|nr:hypothetical protein [Armatimonadota bacterium]